LAISKLSVCPPVLKPSHCLSRLILGPLPAPSPPFPLARFMCPLVASSANLALKFPAMVRCFPAPRFPPYEYVPRCSFFPLSSFHVGGLSLPDPYPSKRYRARPDFFRPPFAAGTRPELLSLITARCRYLRAETFYVSLPKTLRFLFFATLPCHLPAHQSSSFLRLTFLSSPHGIDCFFSSEKIYIRDICPFCRLPPAEPPLARCPVPLATTILSHFQSPVLCFSILSPSNKIKDLIRARFSNAP